MTKKKKKKTKRNEKMCVQALWSVRAYHNFISNGTGIGVERPTADGADLKFQHSGIRASNIISSRGYRGAGKPIFKYFYFII